MIIESKLADAQGNAGVATEWANSFGRDVANRYVRSLNSLRLNLSDPFNAAVAAWTYEYEPESEWITELRDSFPEWLAAMCGRGPKTLAGDPEKAFGVFMARSVVLWERWRTEAPIGERYGSLAAHWCVQHPEIYSRVQAAILARSSQIRIALADWNLDDLKAHGPKGLPKDDKLKLATTLEFSGQRTWTQAATTAAHAVFGDFLMGESESTGFCRLCAKPFRIGKKMLSCSLRCSRNYSARQSREAELRVSRRENLREMSKALGSLLRASHVDWAHWPVIVQEDVGMSTIDGRIRRSLGAYIRAARTEPGSPEREGRLRLLQDPTGVSGSKKWSLEREKLHREFETFLTNILRAEEIRERNGRK